MQRLEICPNDPAFNHSFAIWVEKEKKVKDKEKVWRVEAFLGLQQSGQGCQDWMKVVEDTPDAALVVLDDADLPLGEIRLRGQGGSGGHHGLASIQQHLGDTTCARLRVGIGRTPDGRREITGHVLGQFSSAESELLERVLNRAADQVECWLNRGLQMAMNQFNGVVDSGEEK